MSSGANVRRSKCTITKKEVQAFQYILCNVFVAQLLWLQCPGGRWELGLITAAARKSNLFSLLAATIYYKLLQAVTSCYKLLQSVTSCYKLLQAVTSCYNLLQAVTSCLLLQSIAGCRAWEGMEVLQSNGASANRGYWWARVNHWNPASGNNAAHIYLCIVFHTLLLGQDASFKLHLKNIILPPL